VTPSVIIYRALALQLPAWPQARSPGRIGRRALIYRS